MENNMNVLYQVIVIKHVLMLKKVKMNYLNIHYLILQVIHLNILVQNYIKINIQKKLY